MMTILLTCWHDFRMLPAMGRNKTVFNVVSKQFHSCNQLTAEKQNVRKNVDRTIFQKTKTLHRISLLHSFFMI